MQKINKVFTVVGGIILLVPLSVIILFSLFMDLVLVGSRDLKNSPSYYNIE